MASISEASSSAAASSSPAGSAGSAGSDGSAVKAVLPGKAVTSTASTTTTSNFTSGRSYDSAASAKKLPYSQTQITETVSQRVAKLSAEDFSDDCSGDGLSYLEMVNERGEQATIKDQTAATASFERVRDRGVVGPLRMDSFTAFVKEYKLAKRTIPEDEQPKQQAEAQMMEDDPGSLHAQSWVRPFRPPVCPRFLLQTPQSS